jgi:uncharacterized YigZ family protein
MGYLIPKQDASAEMVKRRSLFIGYIKGVENEEDAISFINEIRKKHHDATHNVYAYIIKENNIVRYSDDGEPQGTAGVPVLNVLKKRELYNVAAVVTRYFGGVLLGAGGLVRAYGSSASLACDAAGAAEMSLCAICSLCCDYSRYGKVQGVILEAGGTVTDTVFEQEVKISFILPAEALDVFSHELTEATAGDISFKKSEEKYVRRDVK